ncbi:DUF6515 family protein [uncultured Maribacter sp.]|uniref:DUF6515 family protein n=1 Tax=uncultured Maribacter sp. TaxID=431308 RepID=UPI00260E5488|nr:DUF6515 family protein [uncultured Maribacter sp.]
MKNLKLFAVSIAILGITFSANAQRKTVKIYPKHGLVVTKIKKPKVITYKSSKYYFADGVWYKNNRRKYIVCAPPVGIVVRNLPRGNKVVKINGRKLYKYKGIWYKKQGRGYIIVNV